MNTNDTDDEVEEVGMAELKVAFNMANLVGRVTGYRFSMSKWEEQHKKTAAQTDEAAWRAICAEIAAAGFKAVEVWIALVDPSVMTAERAGTFKKILREYGLTPIGLGAGYNADTLRVCEWLEISAINGGLWGGASLAEVEKMARQSGVRFNYENHPEASAEEVLRAVDGGNDLIGCAVDTGWFTTHGADATAEIKKLGSLVRHVHVKEVLASGGHVTVPLGTGATQVGRVIDQLKSLGYAGWYAWEDEPEERNPMAIARESREWIERRLV